MFGVLADQASIGMMYTDPSGNQRIEMGVDPDGVPRLVLYDGAGRIRSDIGMRDDGSPTIVLTDSSEARRIALSATNEGSGQIAFFGDAAADTLPPPQRAMMGTFDDGEPAIMFFDKSESTRASLNMSAEGAAQWRFYGLDETTERAVFGVYENGLPIVKLADSVGMATFLRIGGMLPDTTVVPPPKTEGN